LAQDLQIQRVRLEPFTSKSAHMKQLFTLILLLTLLPVAHGQVTPLPVGGGFGQVVNAAGKITRGVVQAKTQQDRQSEQEELDQYYIDLIGMGDTLYSHKNYTDAIIRYNEALRLKQEQYPRDQIAKAQAAIARQNRDPYQLMIDQADSLFTRMYYEEAILRYNEALTLKQEPYPNTQIAKANAELERRKKVHFSGLIISDTRTDGVSSQAHADDPFSDFLQPGRYASVYRALLYSNFRTLDGIAVPAGTRLVVYSERDFKGAVLLDVTGPAIVNNSRLQQDPPSAVAHTRTFTDRLQSDFPLTVRTWSATDMQQWINGSMEITTL
jgi:hypothetical protein